MQVQSSQFPTMFMCPIAQRKSSRPSVPSVPSVPVTCSRSLINEHQHPRGEKIQDKCTEVTRYVGTQRDDRRLPFPAMEPVKMVECVIRKH